MYWDWALDVKTDTSLISVHSVLTIKLSYLSIKTRGHSYCSLAMPKGKMSSRSLFVALATPFSRPSFLVCLYIVTCPIRPNVLFQQKIVTSSTLASSGLL